MYILLFSKRALGNTLKDISFQHDGGKNLKYTRSQAERFETFFDYEKVRRLQHCWSRTDLQEYCF